VVSDSRASRIETASWVEAASWIETASWIELVEISPATNPRPGLDKLAPRSGWLD
jgi:hypothetical protein